MSKKNDKSCNASNETISNYVCARLDIFYLLRILYAILQTSFYIWTVLFAPGGKGWDVGDWMESHKKPFERSWKISMKTFLVWCNFKQRVENLGIKHISIVLRIGKMIISTFAQIWTKFSNWRSKLKHIINYNYRVNGISSNKLSVNRVFIIFIYSLSLQVRKLQNSYNVSKQNISTYVCARIDIFYLLRVFIPYCNPLFIYELYYFNEENFL